MTSSEALLALFGVAAVFATGPLQRGVIVGMGVSELARRRSRWRGEAGTFQFALGGLYVLTAAAVVSTYIVT